MEPDSYASQMPFNGLHIDESAWLTSFLFVVGVVSGLAALKMDTDGKTHSPPPRSRLCFPSGTRTALSSVVHQNLITLRTGNAVQVPLSFLFAASLALKCELQRSCPRVSRRIPDIPVRGSRRRRKVLSCRQSE